MSAVIIDFFEYKYNHNLVVLKNVMDRYREYLEMELAEALRKDTEALDCPFTD